MTVSTGNGRYLVPLLPPGPYRVQATKRGFKELVRSKVTVYVTETAVANLQLTVGAATEVVNVSSEAELLNTQEPAMGKVTNELVVSSLPLVTRNYTQIIGLSPGVATEVANAGALGRGAGSEAVGANGFSVHGGPTNDNNYQVNGVEVNDLMGSGSFSGGIAVPNPDTIQEFKVQTGQYDASYGRNAGANVDLVTKRGTNSLHGTLFEFFRNDVLNANEYFLNRNNQPRAVLKQNQFGASLGGPIAKDELFWFGSYQGTRQRNGLDEDCLSTVNSPPITDDRSAAALGALFNGPSGGAIAADGSNISSQALTLLNLQLPNGEYVVPTPQSINSGEPFFLQGSSTFSQACPFTEDQFLASMDYLQSTKSTLTGRFFYSDGSQTSTVPSNGNIDGGGVPGFLHHVDNDFRVFSLTHTYSFSPNVVNQAMLGYHRLLGRISQDEPFTFADLGVNAPAFDDSFPKIGVVGAFQTGGNGQGVRIAQNIYSFSDSVLWSVGRHALHFGGGIERAQINQLDFHFFGGVQFPDYTQFLLGNATFILDVPGLFDRLWRTWDGNSFLQDDIRLGSRFTLNLGLRYERLGHLTDELGRNSSFDPENADHTGAGSQAGYVVASNLKDVTLPPGVIRAPNEAANNGLGQNAWGPRVGFAWQLPGTNHAVLRGGYGIYYSRTSAQPILQELTGPPFGQVRLLQTLGTPFADPFPPAPTLPSFPTYSAATCTIPLLDPNCVSFLNVAIDAKPPMTQNYSLNTQVGLLSDLALEVGYQGARGTRLWEFRNFNQALSASPESPINGETENTFFNITPRTPVPGISPFGAGQVQSTGASWYNALVASLNKRFSHGLQFLASYTWASALGTSQGFATGTQLGGVALGDQNDPGARYGWDSFV
ncbi:MAG TPA: carboxypeptidase regulatory-like domain-containing protein, partial [Terriglobales bacterium]